MGNDARRTFVTPTQGRPLWADAGVEILKETARTFGATITDADFAARVQSQTSRWTRTPAARWLPTLLSDVTHHCQNVAFPPLAVLVVGRGEPTLGYDAMAATVGLPLREPEVRAQHAAAARFQCHVRWCRELPPEARPHLLL